MYQPFFQVYIANGEECCVYSERVKTLVLLHDPFPNSLLDMLYLDTDELVPLFSRLETQFRRAAETGNSRCVPVIRKSLRELTDIHPYFSFVAFQLGQRLDWALTTGGGQMEEFLRQQELSALPGQIKETQRQILDLLDNALDRNDTDTSISERLALYRNRCLKNGWEAYSFRPLTIHFDVLDERSFAEFVRPDSIFDIIDFFTRECVTREVKLRKCKNCGRYFVPRHLGLEYCDRVANDRGQTCKEIGASHVWEKSRGSDEVFREYRREYKKRFAWIRRGQIDAEVFYSWGEKAREKKAECDDGRITLEEFSEWLKNS